MNELRKIAMRTAGKRHGPITRLLSPGDIGQSIKPFIFLDYVDAPGGGGPNFGFHPHSGIATLTYPLSFDIEHEASSGQIDVVRRGGVEWMMSGSGIWHRGRPANAQTAQRLQAFQMWFAMPPSHENAFPSALFIPPEDVPVAGAVRVLLGSHDGVTSPIVAPVDANYLWVQLKDGDTWTYEPPDRHQVAWVFAQSGQLEVHGELLERELAVFDEGQGSQQFRARGDCGFLCGSAVKHAHELVMGPYSVHTSSSALAAGVREIAQIGERLRRDGRIH